MFILHLSGAIQTTKKPTLKSAFLLTSTLTWRQEQQSYRRLEQQERQSYRRLVLQERLHRQERQERRQAQQLVR